MSCEPKTNDEQKKREMAHLQRFRANCDDFPVVTDDQIKECERPDFLVMIPHRTYGIEHTEFLQSARRRKGSRPRALEVAEDQLVQRALIEYESRGLPPVEVLISFRLRERQGRVTKADIQRAYDSRTSQRLISTIVDIVATNVPLVGDTIPVHHIDAGWKLLPKEVSALDISRWSFTTENCWGVARGGTVPSLSPEDFQAIINDKEGNLPVYKEKCDEVWLLIVAHGFSPSTHAKVSPEVETTVFSTGFERVFFLHHFKSMVLELKTQNLGGNAP